MTDPLKDKTDSGLRSRTEVSHGSVGESTARLSPGTRVGGKYIILRTIGVGGYAKVYEAEHEEIGRRVAIKAVHSHLDHREEILLRFKREARIAAKIHDRHVAEVYDVGHLDDGAPYIVMELLEGKSLDQLLSRGALPLPGVIELGKQLLRAVAAAHRAGVVHRDIKPQNIMLHEEGSGDTVVKLLDFGISKRVTPDISERSLTLHGIVVGSPDYMSPEQLRGQEVDFRTDVYSIGVVLYEALTGQLPYRADNLSDLTAAILRDRVPRPSEIRPDCPAELELIVLRAIEKEREGRYPSLRAIASDFEAFAKSSGLEATIAWNQLPSDTSSQSEVETEHFGRPEYALGLPPPSEEAPPPPRRTKAIWIGAGIVAFVLGMGAALWSTQPEDASVVAAGDVGAVGEAEAGESSTTGVVTSIQAHPAERAEGSDRTPVTEPASEEEAIPVEASPAELNGALANPVGAETPSMAAPPAMPPSTMQRSTATGMSSSAMQRSTSPVSPSTMSPSTARPPTSMTSPDSESASTALSESRPESESESEAPSAGQDDAGSLVQRATAAYLQGHLPTALGLYRQAVDQNPSLAAAWRGIGLVTSRMGQRQQAIRAFERYLALRPNASDAGSIRERLRALGWTDPAAVAAEAPSEAPSDDPPAAAP
ncbi:MAG: tetratricopeptide repeat protein [Myxococcota bacterium]